MTVSIIILVLWVIYKLGKYAIQKGIQIEDNNKLKRNLEEYERKNKNTI
tara:strand:+ start:461 stop:607 length:147 start_codon:yes stop_codon:yes gene_type:complete